MKIKNWFTSIDIEVNEVEKMHYHWQPYERVGLFWWIKKTFGLDMLPKPEIKKK